MDVFKNTIRTVQKKVFHCSNNRKCITFDHSIVKEKTSTKKFRICMLTICLSIGQLRLNTIFYFQCIEDSRISDIAL